MSYQNITLTSGITTITLPGDMVWVDRRNRSVVSLNTEVAANGAVVFEEFQQIGGYPVTLVAGGAGDTWVFRPQIDQLIALADVPQTSPMTLVYNDGTVLSVRFYRQNGQSPVEAKVLYSIFPEDDETPYSLTLRLIQANA